MSPKVLLTTSCKARSKQTRLLQQRLKEMHAPLSEVAAAQRLATPPEVLCEILYPPTGLQTGLADDTCLVARWSTAHWKILYTADSGLPTERWLLENARDKLSADVWIRGSHAREPTGSEEFVRAVQPRIVLVAGSRFHQTTEPLEAWAAKWRSRGITVWLQQNGGAVEAWAGATNRMRTFVNHDTLSWPTTHAQ
jgi:beta-lactamase superfamily II metal-dependent hydrolase